MALRHDYALLCADAAAYAMPALPTDVVGAAHAQQRRRARQKYVYYYRDIKDALAFAATICCRCTLCQKTW